jgi:transcriptional antiterminator NusG
VIELSEGSTRIFAVSVTVGQEKNVAKIIMGRVEVNNVPIKAILIPENLKGYIFIEADGPHFVERAVANIKHVKSRVQGALPLSDIEKYILVKSAIDELNINDIVEIVSGPFKGMRAKVTDIDRDREEVTVELLEASFTLPVTVHVDYVKIVSKEK